MQDANRLKVLVIGAYGMLGSAVLNYLDQDPRFHVKATARKRIITGPPLAMGGDNIIDGVDVTQFDTVIRAIEDFHPRVVINCAGVIKQDVSADDPTLVLPVNSIFPHQLANWAGERKLRIIQISTDCVFDGVKGAYRESDKADATDLYGISKLLGELSYDHCLTIRTSIIGHEIGERRSLLEWFLSQSGEVRGFKNAVFSGLPTFEIASIIANYVIPDSSLQGVYHVSGDPINKYELLSLIARIYDKKISVLEDSTLNIDRSLNSQRFQHATGYKPRAWPELIRDMRNFHQGLSR